MSTAFDLPALGEPRTARPSTIANRVYDALRAAVVQLDFKPGSPLSEADVARRLGVSRQPVREAFIKLGEVGLVEIRPQRGTFVRLISVREVENARFLREAIERAVVRKAALEAKPDHLAEMRRRIEEQRMAAAAGDNAAFLSADERFHQAVARGADCEEAWRVVEGLKAQMDRVRYLSLPDATPFDVLLEQHRAVADAIAGRAPEAAERAMREHLAEILLSLPKLAQDNPAYFER